MDTTNPTTCFECETDLTPDNTRDFGGFDKDQHQIARIFFPNISKDEFAHCDNCSYARVDRYITSTYEGGE